MATNNVNRSTRIDPETIGNNFGQLFVYSAVAVVVTVLLVLALWYGFYIDPLQNTLGGETARPLREQVPLEIMPALPDELEAAYDTYTMGEYDRISSFGMVDEETGTVHIPVEDAQAMMLEEGAFPVREEGADTSED